MLATPAQLTPNSLLSLPELDDGHYELSDGELIVVGAAGALHEFIKAQLYELLTARRFRTNSGHAFSETMFTLRADRARIPGVSWVSKARLPLIPRENRAIPIAPDIAIEIALDSEQPQQSEQKLRDYLVARRKQNVTDVAGRIVVLPANGLGLS
ncbi:MAG TPA: Uma2 family endonuclease [Bryobacteraceae bacterium]|nr:Uma2 family endonuclease [Bryobacteraceae bacterium]